MDESSSKLLDRELATLERRRRVHELEAPRVERDDANGRALRTDLTGIALSGTWPIEYRPPVSCIFGLNGSHIRSTRL
jgi:hypothetical protein